MLKLRYNKLITTLFILIILFAFFIPNVALANHAFSCGGDYGNFSTWDDAITAANYYATMGYSSFYSTDPSYSTLNGNFSDGWRRLHSDILFFSSHGNSNGVYFPDSSLVVSNGNSSSVYTKNVNWDYVRLVVFGGCETAAGTYNITNDTHDRKVEVSIGWQRTIGNVSHSQWLDRFNSKINSGATVGEAVDYAHSFTYNDPNVKRIVRRGSENLRLRLTRAFSVDEFSSNSNSKFGNNLKPLEKLNTINLNNKKILFNSNNDIDNIINVIKENNPSFNKNDYKIDVIETSYDNDFTIDIYLLGSNNSITNYGYTVNVSDNIVTSIVDNTYDINQVNVLNSNSNVTNEIENLAKSEGLDNLKNNLKPEYQDKCKILDQNTSIHQDLKNNSTYIVVLTHYTLDGESSAVDEYLYYL